MRRWWFLAGLLLAAWAAAVPAQDLTLPGYVRDDLELVSQESLPTWSARWTGPIEAATILAWLAEHGYSQFVTDLNGDGVVDVLDTIRLADDLGRMLMGTETQRGTTDARLALGLAQYVAGRYPGEFVLKVYDLGFPSEVAADGYGAYSPTMIPGILLEVKPNEPNIAAYEFEMEDAEGVILGLSAVTSDNNTYLAGRSFLYQATTEGYTPIDLASSEEDLWQTGTQGQVVETAGRMTDQFYIQYHGQWTPVEFMLALSPLHPLEAYGQPAPCPQDAIAYDVTRSTTRYGTVEIAECVTRTTVAGGPTLDTYTYSLTNIDFTYGGCGVCLFFIPNPAGFVTTDMTGPAFWMQHAGWSGWWWKAPASSCGILPGGTGVFSFTIVGPSTDTSVTGAVAPCEAAYPTIAQTRPPTLPVKTTGPDEWKPDDDQPGGDCPDLTVGIKSQECEYSPTNGGTVITIVVTVTNIGGASSGASFLRFESSSGNHTSTVPVLAPGASVNRTFTFTSSANNPPDCPMEYTATVDPYHLITECDEDNNSVEGGVFCPRCID